MTIPTQTKDRMRQGAYTAVGAPVAGYRATKDQVGKLVDSIDETRKSVKDDLIREFDQWVAEGEVVVDRMLEWMRSSGVTEELRNLRRSATKRVRTGIDEITRRVDDALDFVEPEIELTEIRGIGPASADKLAAAKITGIKSFLDETSTDSKLEDLSKATGILATSLREWRARADLTRVDGVGEAYQRLLHAAGIGTLTHLMNEEASDLAASIDEIDRPGLPDQYPSESEIARWIVNARKLDLSS